MGVFRRNSKWYIELANGKQKSTGLEAAPENKPKAEQVLKKVEQQLADLEAKGKRIRRRAVRDYFEEWTKSRTNSTAKDEATRIREHALPHIGDIGLSKLQSSHIRRMVDALKEGPLAPRSQLHVYQTVKLMLKRAERDDLIDRNPCNLDKTELPRKVDKDPEWRANAVFSRHEVLKLITAEGIPDDRRVVYSLIFLTGGRIGEVTALKWNDIEERKPLDRLLIARSYNTKQKKVTATKTQTAREVPIHRTLRKILDSWWANGWEERYGRPPKAEDLIVPQPLDRRRNRRNGGPKTHWSADTFRKRCYDDLKMLGLRRRSPHDGRATFISLTREDGASAILERVTHAPQSTVRDGYTRPSWKALCAEISKLQIDLDEDPADDDDPGTDSSGGPKSTDTVTDSSEDSGIIAKKMEPAGIEESTSPRSPRTRSILRRVFTSHLGLVGCCESPSRQPLLQSKADHQDSRKTSSAV